MRVSPQIVLTDEQESELSRLARAKRTIVRLAQRAHIVLLAAKGVQNKDISEQLGVGWVQVARWRERYLQAGLPGIERNLPRGAPPVKVDVIKHQRFHMHCTPTSASWLNMVERFFCDITTERLRRGVFTSVAELGATIDEYVAHHNINPKPFIWTKSARDIRKKVIRANDRLILLCHKIWHDMSLMNPRWRRDGHIQGI